MRNNNTTITVRCIFLLIGILTCVYNDSLASNRPIAECYSNVKKPFTVVIDAGHGGKDSGTLGKKSKEKNVALAIAIKVGEKIEQFYDDVKVIYTRKDDTFIPLFERINVANDADADLFISIHCNASARRSANGTETFVMGLHTADENLETAKRENSAILLENDFESNYEGFDPNSDAGHIILSMYQNLYLDQSIEFASMVEEEFGLKTSRGVKQAGFVVLRRATMPAILVETGFLSNPSDEKRLLSKKGQEKISSALFTAFQKYKSIKSPVEVTLDSLDHKEPIIAQEFRIQVAAKKEVQTDLFAHVDGLEIFKEGNLYKYVTRPYADRAEAIRAKELLVASGYKEAFIVVYPKDSQSLTEK